MIRILIADDHALVRGGLKQIIATTSDIVVAAEAGHGGEVLDKLRTCTVDLLLLDMTMPRISGVDLIRRVRAEHPSLPVLVLSIHDEAQVASRALRAGAAGYLTKDSDPDVFFLAIRKLAAGGSFIDPKLVDAMVFDTHRGDMPPHEVLSDREFRVLQMLAAGRSINEIADTFSLSAKTISTHKMRLMRKLALANNAEVIRYAIRYGLTPSEVVG
ncbi:two component transcriptional regulator, LuxR family [Paraburkholderia steynii]|uniref:Two component transcriptional regulator, LuxR family n=1 Tax=Paraburkholderia steynii TaxID=1245441 RepID=A0A7Z7FKV1_9BURK|nr:response regulator transcription factor [Paraburkholderia steynii]SDI56175.1 two component transcriptional regulator, LuxR family [Paraburkholderia steynii]